MKKRTAKTVSPAQLTKSRADIEFIGKSSLPREKAIHVVALRAGISDRAVRRQLRKSGLEADASA